MNYSITSQEISHSIKKCRSKSLGPDQIPYVLIINFGRTFELLTILYNNIFGLGILSETWKSGIVISIPKPGKNKFCNVIGTDQLHYSIRSVKFLRKLLTTD